jgi:LruC domain-containing protein
MKNYLKLLVILLLGFFLVNCQKTNNLKTSENKDNDGIKKMYDLEVKDHFNWTTIKDVMVSIKLPEDNPYDLLKITDADGKKIFFSGYRDDDSQILNTLITIPSYVSLLKIQYGNEDLYPSFIVDANSGINIDLREYSGERNICGCYDGLHSLSMKFNGLSDATILVLENGTSDVLFNATVNQETTFSFASTGVGSVMDELIDFYVDGVYNATINTSCDVDLFIADVYGSFSIVAGESKNLVPLCPQQPGGPNTLVYDGTLAFEDLWPSEGDYDFNDLVIDYDFNITKNTLEQIEKIDVSFTLHAMGAGFYNGFGFSFPNVLPSQISQVSGYQLKTNSIISVGSNGLENAQSKATIIVFDDCFDIMQHPGIGTGINTEQWTPFVQPITLDIEILFMENGVFPEGGPVTFQQLNIGHFNPFLIVNQIRGKEVHLPGYRPTDLANTSLFGEWDDNSNPTINRYYVTENNYPWAINIPDVFNYPIERMDINNAYNHFKEWAESDGSQYPDWFKNYPAYRNSEFIYQIAK